METFRAGNIEVWKNDYPEVLTRNHAIVKLNELGDGWRFPTLIEMGYFMRLHRGLKIGGFQSVGRHLVDVHYWIENIESNPKLLSAYNLGNNGYAPLSASEGYKIRLRPVRPVI